VDRLRQRFHLTRICLVVDRGMISKQTLVEPGTPAWGALPPGRPDLAGQRGSRCRGRGPGAVRGGLRSQELQQRPRSAGSQENKGEFSSVGGLPQCRAGKKRSCRSPSNCVAPAGAIEAGDRSLMGSQGYRKFLQTTGASRRFAIDEHKIRADEKYDGLCVLPADLDLSAKAVVCITRNGGGSGRPFGRSNRSWRTGPSTTRSMRRSAGTWFAAFWRWYCSRSCRRG